MGADGGQTASVCRLYRALCYGDAVPHPSGSTSTYAPPAARDADRPGRHPAGLQRGRPACDGGHHPATCRRHRAAPGTGERGDGGGPHLVLVGRGAPHARAPAPGRGACADRGARPGADRVHGARRCGGAGPTASLPNACAPWSRSRAPWRPWSSCAAAASGWRWSPTAAPPISAPRSAATRSTAGSTRWWWKARWASASPTRASSGSPSSGWA